ncbi:MAG TPA: adenylate kinase [Patescibacteria group bacterium]|nr:adenylate kinase [Patescibacteria group bacterium]
MINFIIFGAPGAGKGTQAKKIANIHQLQHLSTGDLFRKEIKNKTELGIEAQNYSSKGELVPDSLVIEILKKEIEKHPESSGFIFDGFPRNLNQAQELDKMLKEKDTKIQAVLALEVPNEELIRRIKDRAKDSKRIDDQNEEIINNRLKIYKEDTQPLLNYYQEQNKVHNINGLGTIDEITDRLNKAIDKLI